MFDERACHAFGDCIKAGDGHISLTGKTLVIDRENIKDISSLRNVCPSKALIVSGREMSVSQIMCEIEKDMPFFQMSGGGVTISGGEPFSQDPFIRELFIELKKKDIDVSVETSLHVPWESIEKNLDYIDVLLADLKHIDAEKFTKYTGGNVALVLDNFRKLDEKGKTIVVRVPVIPEFNFSESELFAIIDFAAGLKNSDEINFIPFHSLAREKYAMLGRTYIFEYQRNIEKSELIPFVEYAEKKGLSPKIMN